jgi:hypothetical protein
MSLAILHNNCFSYGAIEIHVSIIEVFFDENEYECEGGKI